MKFLTTLSAKQKVIAVAIATVIVAGVAAITTGSRPQPSATIRTVDPTESVPVALRLWVDAVNNVSTLKSYHLKYHRLKDNVEVNDLDVMVGANGDWYGTVTVGGDLNYPLTMASISQHLYVQGGANFVSDAQELFGIPPAAATVLGNRWYQADSYTGESEVVYMNNSLTPLVHAGSLSIYLPNNLDYVTSKQTALNGQSVVDLRNPPYVMDVIPGQIPYPIHIEGTMAVYDLSDFNKTPSFPSVSQAVTWDQLAAEAGVSP
jgi:hypothetical protein